MQCTTSELRQSRGVIELYREFLPVSDSTPIVSLGEGNTTLIYCPQLSKRVGRGCEVFVKNEGVNPTGSFKDRGMTVAVSKAMERAASAIICASTGNTSASAAAYAARAGILCIVILPTGKIATGKLLQAFAYGAKMVAIDGNFDDALGIVRELGDSHESVIVNSINPDRIAGQKTAAFEIVDVLGDAPDFHLLPVGNAGNISAYWRGFVELGLSGGLSGIPSASKIHKGSCDDWFSSCRRGPNLLQSHRGKTGNDRICNSNRESSKLETSLRGNR